MASTDFFREQVQSTDYAYISQTQLGSRPLYQRPAMPSSAYQNEVGPPLHGLILQTAPVRQPFYPSFHTLRVHTYQDRISSLPNMSDFYQAADRVPDIVGATQGMDASPSFLDPHNRTSHTGGPSSDANFRPTHMHSFQAPEAMMTGPSPSLAWSQSPSPTDCTPAHLRRHSLVTAPYPPSFETGLVSGNLLGPAQGMTRPSCFCNKRDNYAMVACGAFGHNGPKWFHLECVGLARAPPCK